MNCPSRVDPLFEEGHNQNPNALNADATTRADMNHMANARLRSDHCIDTTDGPASEIETKEQDITEGDGNTAGLKSVAGKGNAAISEKKVSALGAGSPSSRSGGAAGHWHLVVHHFWQKALAVLRKYAKFVGPGFMVAVAYIDPGTLSSIQQHSMVFMG
jgi:metal iron transporter